MAGRRPRRLDPYRLRLDRDPPMLVDATIYAGAEIADAIEPDSIEQLRDAASMPGAVAVLATPDIHVGYGVPIGCVMATDRTVSPAAVGYDINCGMRLLTTPLQAAEADVDAVARSIQRDVPLGEGKRNVRLSDSGFAAVLERGVPALADAGGDLGRYGQVRDPDEERADLERIEDNGSLPGSVSAVSARAFERGSSQLGTLGGGNHFIELQIVDRVDDASAAETFGMRQGQLVAMIHSGSRGLGHEIAGDYMKLGARLHGKEAPSGNLAFLLADEDAGRRYMEAMAVAANFAYANRQVMTAFLRRAIRGVHGPGLPVPLVYDVTHNVAKRERHLGRDLIVHRKGATRAWPAGRMAGTPFAATGSPVLIPGSMGTASYLLLPGPNAEDSLCSVNHGAGRVMSRSAAAGGRRGRGGGRGLVSEADLREAMKGITLIAGSRSGALEEAPQAYKDIDLVIETVVGAGLARSVARMRPLAVLKG